MKASIKEGNGNASDSSEEEDGKLKEEERSLIVEEILKANDGMDFVLEDMMTQAPQGLQSLADLEKYASTEQ